MDICPACGHEGSAPAKFCPECGTALMPSRAPAREERKVITVLFADLVGFTSRSERLDPEDVRAFLSPFYTRLRGELEAHGGTVEKFIGDAVMALFGAPLAHEDDPERAVRAALAIRDWIMARGDELRVRIGVNTGEALVALDARPTQGEGMASGDVVNTTARLQTGAPVNGVLVGESTYRATKAVISYRPVDPISAKGKAEPVLAWEALEARSRFGVDLGSASRAPLAGRQREMNLLKETLQRVRADRSTQLVTLVGVPGMGKSRLVAELFRVVEDDPIEITSWRQGRSLPYGEGVTFWALSEMVKAQAGILESDTSEAAEQKLAATVDTLFPRQADADWILGHLRALVGVRDDQVETGGRGREEGFAAWRRFFEALAEQKPLVLVFEDLHWADDNLLDFVDHLVGWAGAVPLLVICTARPELFDRRAGWAGGLRNSATAWLAPLNDLETAELINKLSDRPLMDAVTHQALLDRAGGNPLYAEQYVRMLDERGDGEHMPLPETVQGIIAARLDALSAEDKPLLQTAAVVGKVFWLGALARVGGFDRHGAEARLHALERKDFVQRARRSSVAEESEFAFLHVLVRDVAYGQIPRTQRGDVHVRTAEWIASLGRPEDYAEMLAHHYRNAIELRRATGQTIDAALALKGLESLWHAGDRASALNAYASAIDFYRSALELASEGSRERAHLLLKVGLTQYHAGDLDPDTLETASKELLAIGDLEMAAEAQVSLSRTYSRREEPERTRACLAGARALVNWAEATRIKAEVLSMEAGMMMVAGDYREAIRLGREALAIAEQLGLDDVRAHALDSVGSARCDAGDPDGVNDLELSVEIATNTRSLPHMFRARMNLSSVLWTQGQLGRSQDLSDEAYETSIKHGRMNDAQYALGKRAEQYMVLGRWEESLADADAFLAAVETGPKLRGSSECHAVRSVVRFGRDDVQGALADIALAVQIARQTMEATSIVRACGIAADLHWQLGNPETARALADEAMECLKDGNASVMDYLHVLAWTAAALGRGQDLVSLMPRGEGDWARAARLFAEGDLRGAADVCAAMGALTEEARDRLRLAEQLGAEGRQSEAEIELQLALAFYRSVGATRYMREAEGLLAASA
jgi:class 3 adenylate cyclase/tetratricopeptide (TPR) repeat protein